MQDRSMRISVVLFSLSLTVAVAPMPERKAEPGGRGTTDAMSAVSNSAGVRLAGAIGAKPSHAAVANTSFEVRAGTRVKERMRVRFDRDTVFLDSDPGDLEPGRAADIIGVQLRNGDFLAARVIVYEGDCPVRTPGGAILFRVHADNGRDAKPVLPTPCNSGVGTL
jgi:hypothetical protein